MIEYIYIIYVQLIIYFVSIDFKHYVKFNNHNFEYYIKIEKVTNSNLL